jgi:hypothetical protein
MVWTVARNALILTPMVFSAGVFQTDVWDFTQPNGEDVNNLGSKPVHRTLFSKSTF